MNKRESKKLTLKRETLQALTSTQLALVAGGTVRIRVELGLGLAPTRDYGDTNCGTRYTDWCQR